MVVTRLGCSCKSSTSGYYCHTTALPPPTQTTQLSNTTALAASTAHMGFGLEAKKWTNTQNTGIMYVFFTHLLKYSLLPTFDTSSFSASHTYPHIHSHGVSYAVFSLWYFCQCGWPSAFSSNSVPSEEEEEKLDSQAASYLSE